MEKKMSCHDVKVPRPLNEAETRLYGWVEEAVLTQPSVVESHSLLEFCRNFSLTEDSRMEGEYVLEAVGPSDRVPFRADDLLDVKMKKTKVDNLMAMMADPSRMAPRAIFPTGRPSATAAAASAAGPTPAESSSQASPVLTASEAHKAKKQSSKRERVKVVDLEGEEGLKEDPNADLQRKRRKKKAKEDDAFEKALGDDSAWEHDVDPVEVAFLENFNYRKAFDAGLTSAPVREALVKMPPEQLLGESYHLSARSLACLQVGVETSLAAKVKAEKELSAALDQIEILKGERDSALAFLPLKEKVDNLDDQLSERTAEFRSALERITQLEEDNGVLKAQLESSQLSLEGEKKRSEAAEKAGGTSQADLSNAIEATEYWRAEWWKLGAEATKMCQETLDVCLDQVSHLCPGVDFSAITLKTLWDPKARRIFVPHESDVEEEPPRAQEVAPEQHPGTSTQASQPAAGDVGAASGGCAT
ncbi:hypothetical protein PIB30_004451 [Stylosanthes scabra]|uniref:Uncharacterized protein n=1 Tax=Stylosanthes scabra TaxID=79078 RepID=A0ABU6W1T7_9FABA|nr:hypothetical protein [Stylosanthes scabra]